MQTYNNIASAIFDFLLAPFGHELELFDLIVWPVLMGIGALQVYKYTSNQGAIARVKRQISMHLLEIRLCREDIAQVLKSTLKIIAKNVIYIAHNLTPMAVMLIPMIALMVQLVAHYAYEPAQPGSVELLHLKLDPNAAAFGARCISRSTRRHEPRCTGRANRRRPGVLARESRSAGRPRIQGHGW